MLGLILITILVLALVVLGPMLLEQARSEEYRGSLAVYGPSLGLIFLIVIVAMLWGFGVI